MSAESSTPEPWWAQSAARPLPPRCRRVLLIGLDGATFDILQPMIALGHMPHFKQLLEHGAQGIMMSTVPPITPAAWSTFMTGKGPGRHGILDFERYDPKTNQLSFNSSYEIKERTIWDILSDAGLRIGSIQLPMTYPPKPVNGFVVSGFETPGTHTGFTYPADLKEDILQHWPDFNFKTKWKRKTFGGLSLFQENLDYIKRSFDQGVFLTRHCGEKYGWDVLMVLFKLVDNLQHKTWKYLDPQTSGRDPVRAERCAACFSHLDRCLGELVDYADSRDATIMIMSDHGHGALNGKIQANLLLRDWGYLAVDAAAQKGTRARYILNRWFGKSKGKFAANYGIERDLAIDWAATRAFVAHAGMCGFLYLNLKDRQPFGVVAASEYEALREELAAKLLDAEATVPGTGNIKLFEQVHKPEELYDCPREQYDWLPDLLLAPTPGLTVVRKIRGGRPVAWSPYRKLEGTHRMEGVFVAAGPGIAPGAVDATLADVAPTVLAALGLRVPEDMEGAVVEQIFETPPVIEYERPTQAAAMQQDDAVYSEQEQAVLTERLADLGYLE